MNESNTRRLYREFPNLYSDKDSPDSVSRVCDGFSCGDGWFDLIYKLSQQLEKLIVEYKKDNSEDSLLPRAFQIKEKFGTLRFYMSNGTKEMQTLISEAEQKSNKICEKCGRPGKLRNERRWLQTLCETHNKNQ